MVVGLAVLELHLPSSQGLKEKRRVVKSLVERMHERYRVSAAETAHHDLLQRAEIGIAAVGTDERQIGKLFDELRRLVDSEVEAFVTRWDVQFLEEGA